jgi:polyhydroxyalkanoate synthesis regulator phasin
MFFLEHHLIEASQTLKINKMETLKNFVYAGIGLASVTAEKTKETIDGLVEKGMISDTEGKKIISDFIESTEEKRKEFEDKIKSASDKLTSKFDFLNKDKEIDSLKEQISQLEIKLAKTKNKEVAKAKTTNKKVVKAKTTNKKVAKAKTTNKSKAINKS